jgi:hypothetical protein
MTQEGHSQPNVTEHSEELQNYNMYRVKQGKPPLAPTTKYKKPRGLAMSDEAWDGLRSLAKQLGYMPPYDGNITQLLEAIGYGMWILTPAN